jgi:hypothetical protein
MFILRIGAAFNLLWLDGTLVCSLEVWSGSELDLFIGFLVTLYGRGGMSPLTSLMLSFLLLDF